MAERASSRYVHGWRRLRKVHGAVETVGAAGRFFLDWLSLPSGLKWLDVGCGTGAFTEAIQKMFSRRKS